MNGHYNRGQQRNNVFLSITQLIAYRSDCLNLLKQIREKSLHCLTNRSNDLEITSYIRNIENNISEINSLTNRVYLLNDVTEEYYKKHVIEMHYKAQKIFNLIDLTESKIKLIDYRSDCLDLLNEIKTKYLPLYNAKQNYQVISCDFQNIEHKIIAIQNLINEVSHESYITDEFYKSHLKKIHSISKEISGLIELTNDKMFILQNIKDLQNYYTHADISGLVNSILCHYQNQIMPDTINEMHQDINIILKNITKLEQYINTLVLDDQKFYDEFQKINDKINNYYNHINYLSDKYDFKHYSIKENKIAQFVSGKTGAIITLQQFLAGAVSEFFSADEGQFTEKSKKDITDFVDKCKKIIEGKSNAYVVEWGDNSIFHYLKEEVSKNNGKADNVDIKKIIKALDKVIELHNQGKDVTKNSALLNKIVQYTLHDKPIYNDDEKKVIEDKKNQEQQTKLNSTQEQKGCDTELLKSLLRKNSKSRNLSQDSTKPNSLINVNTKLTETQKLLETGKEKQTKLSQTNQGDNKDLIKCILSSMKNNKKPPLSRPSSMVAQL